MIYWSIDQDREHSSPALESDFKQPFLHYRQWICSQVFVSQLCLVGSAGEKDEKVSLLKEMNRARQQSRQRKDWTCEDARQAPS